MKQKISSFGRFSSKHISLSIMIVISIVMLLALSAIFYKYTLLKNDYLRVVLLAESPSRATTGSEEASKYLRPYQDPEIVKITQELGIHENNIQGLELRFVDTITTKPPADGAKPIVDPAAAFIPGYYQDNKNGEVKRAPKIEIKARPTDQDLYRIVAHEYLHHMYSSWWYKDTARAYDQDLILFYTNNQSIREKLSNYTENGSLKLTEVYAYACTEYTDDELGDSMTSICNQWLDRSKLLL